MVSSFSGTLLISVKRTDFDTFIIVVYHDLGVSLWLEEAWCQFDVEWICHAWDSFSFGAHFYESK